MGSTRKTLLGGLLLAATLALLWYSMRSVAPERVTDGGAGAAAFEIHVLGASTAYGEPYGPDLHVGALASYLLGGSVDGRPVVGVNHAHPGGDTTRVLASVEGVPAGAGVVFLYAGHNEFLRIDEPYDLSKPERALVDRDPLTADERRAYLDRYAANMTAMVEALQARGVPVILSTLAANVAGWEPNRSTVRDPENRAPVQALAEGARAALRARDPSTAERELQAILQLEPGFAWAHFELGNLRRAAGRLPEARRHYGLALDHDAYPCRALSSQNEALRRIGREHGVPVLEAADALEALAPDGLVGYELMWDNCHPTLAGYTAIARLLAEEVAALLGATLPDVDASPAALEAFFEHDDERRFAVLHSRGQYMYINALLVWDPLPRLERARAYLRQALAIRRDADVLSSLAVQSALADQPAESGVFWRQALEAGPALAVRRWKNPRVQEIMRRSEGLRAESARLQAELER